MANNRVTYATAQLSIKDNKFDSTNDILGWARDAFLASGVDSSQVYGFGFQDANGANLVLETAWGNNKCARIKTGSAATEVIRYTTWNLNGSGWEPTGVERGVNGSTAGAHNAGDAVQLCGWEVPLGVQSVSVGTAFNTEDVFTLGQLGAYENVEGIPDIEVSIERVFDGTKPLFLMVTDPDYSTLKGRTANYKADIAVQVYPDSGESATGTADSTCVASGCYISSWSASFTADGNFTESVTMVGNDKSWGEQEGVPSGHFLTGEAYDATVVGSGIQRSEDFNRSASTMPSDIQATDHIQSIEVSVDITRDEIYRLGDKTPYYRAVSYPITVTSTFEVITDAGDKVNAVGTGADNLSEETIVIKTNEGLTIDLGTKNKLANVSFEGFDTGGGNGTCTFEYTNSNILAVTHDQYSPAFATNTDRYTDDNAVR